MEKDLTIRLWLWSDEWTGGLVDGQFVFAIVSLATFEDEVLQSYWSYRWDTYLTIRRDVIIFPVAEGIVGHGA